jgi:hypothetical protein
MPHARKIGTAWDKKIDDFAYTRYLDRPGWAWEYLRRNEAFQFDCRRFYLGAPIAIKHISGTTYLKPLRRYMQAEKWGLLTFPNPCATAIDADVFWNPCLLSCHVQMSLQKWNDNNAEVISLDDFKGRRVVLSYDSIEHVIVRNGEESARLSAKGHSILHGSRKFTFEIEGFSKARAAQEAIEICRKLAKNKNKHGQSSFPAYSKWRDYLIALDGHLAGRSYRDIAEVLYGSDRVGPHWTDDSRGYKSKVRRAVERGLELMNGGYRDLL